MNAITLPSSRAYEIVDHAYDVVVVGAGGAGLRATLGASQAQTAMSVMLGNGWNDLVQPFWILPALALSLHSTIAERRAKLLPRAPRIDPDELVDAARIDGSGILGVYRHIMLPLAMPAFGVSMIWQFTSIWNDYLIGVVVLSNPDMRTVMVAVKNLTGSFFTNYGAQMAAALIAASPTIIVYLLLSSLFHRGLLAGSVKG